MTSNDPLHEFFEALFRDPTERQIIAAAMEGRDADDVIRELLAKKEARK